ncbi:MAG: ABC transporter ATP-binding protein [Planctomycetes bacterium]|nr:ABC transporter ATP-binding protein [Planctomycetota bacterium]
MHITIDGLTKRYRSVVALDEVDLEIGPGQVVAVLGPNGAGKTTLLRSLAAIAAPDAGEIYYDGELFRRDRLDLRKRYCFQPDFPFVYSEMTVLEHISLVLRLYEVEREGIEQRVVELLRDFDMLTLIDARFGRLSRGQSYKAALVALLAVDPELWMFDEPFASGMDPRGLTAFRRHAMDATRRGRTVLYTTQILELAESFSDRVCIIHDGRVVAFDSIERLRSAVREPAGGVLEALFEQLHEAVIRAEDSR